MTGFPLRDHRSCLMLSQLVLDLIEHDKAALGKLRRLRKGAALWGPTDKPDRMYVLTSGRLQITTTDDSGRELLLQTVVAGEPFGELCFCAEDGGMRRSMAAAMDHSEVTEIAYTSLLRYLHARPDLLDAVVMTFCSRLHECQLRTEALGHRDAEQRIGRLLLMLSARPHMPDRPEATLAVTHRDLALIADLTRSHVIAILNRFKFAGAIDYKPAGPLVVRLAALQQLLNSDSPRRSRRSLRRPPRDGSR